jgi:hypothetical protein
VPGLLGCIHQRWESMYIQSSIYPFQGCLRSFVGFDPAQSKHETQNQIDAEFCECCRGSRLSRTVDS